MSLLRTKTAKLKHHWAQGEFSSVEFQHSEDPETEKENGSNPMLILDSTTGGDRYVFESKEEAISFFEECLNVLRWKE